MSISQELPILSFKSEYIDLYKNLYVSTECSLYSYFINL